MAQNLSLFQIVREVARRHGLAIPPAIVGSTNETIAQLWGLSNETVEELAGRYKWTELITPLTFTHSNGPDYGALQFSRIGDWRGLQPGTLVDSEYYPVLGPVNDVQWTNNWAPAPKYGYRISGGWLRIRPCPSFPPDYPFHLEYYSSAPVIGTGTGSLQDYFADDADTCRLPSHLVILGLRWRYKKEKGLPYAEDKDTYEMQVADWTSNTGQQKPVIMDADERYVETGPLILVPSASWPLP